MKKYELVVCELKNRVAYIGLNRQNARNALNYNLLDEIVHACESANDDHEVGAIVIYSMVNNVFSAGADLKERDDMTDEQIRKRRIFASKCYARLEAIEKPIIAAVDGKVIGGGGEIIGCCDFIIGSDRSTYRYTEVAVGSVGATQRITRFIGKQRAKELLFTGREIGAQEAWQIGLIARVLPVENFMCAVEQTAQIVANRSPITLAASKKAINMAAEVSSEQGVLIEQLAIELNIAKGPKTSGKNIERQ